MEAVIISLVYVANVFLNRWLNKKLYKIDKFNGINPMLWFFPIVTTVVFGLELINEQSRKNKFTGKNW
jgi:hypothetical protein